jgi:hypothetical protein
MPEIVGSVDHVGGGGAGTGAAFETVTVTVEEPVALPFFEYAFAVSWCMPSGSRVVFSPPATPLYSQGATCSVHLTLPSMAKSTRSTLPDDTWTCQVMLPETVWPFPGETVVTARLFPALAGIAMMSSARRKTRPNATRSLRCCAIEVAADLTAVRIDVGLAERIPRTGPLFIPFEG